MSKLRQGCFTSTTVKSSPFAYYKTAVSIHDEYSYMRLGLVRCKILPGTLNRRAKVLREIPWVLRSSS